MAGTKITALTAITTLADADVFPVVDDPAGTPVTKKITALNIKNYVQSLLGSTGTGIELTPITTATSLPGIQAVASATPHTKGAYVELDASTAFAVETLVVHVLDNVAVTATNTSMLLDIATGASSSEVVLIPNLMVGYAKGSGVSLNLIKGPSWEIPIAIPAGTRLAARIQGAVVSDTCIVAVELRQAGTHSAAPTAITAYGVNTGTSNGVALTAAGTNHVKSAWTEIEASSDADMNFMIVCVCIPALTTVTAAEGLIDIGIGAAASETVLIGDIPYAVSAAEEVVQVGNGQTYTVTVPAGTRISARYQASSTAAGARPSVTVYGLL